MDSHTELLTAIRNGLSYRIIKKIIQYIDDINVGITDSDTDPILVLFITHIKQSRVPSFNRHPDFYKIVKLLIRKGIDPNTKFSNNHTLLYMLRDCNQEQYLKSIQFLLKNGADPNITPPNREKMIDCACTKVKEILINYQIVGNSKDYDEIVQLVNSNSSIQNLTILLKYADINNRGLFEILKYSLNSNKNLTNILTSMGIIGIDLKEFPKEFINDGSFFEILKNALNANKTLDNILNLMTTFKISLVDFSEELIKFIENNEISVDVARVLLKNGLKIDCDKIKFRKGEPNKNIISFINECFVMQKQEYEKQIEILNSERAKLTESNLKCSELINSFLGE